MYRKNFKYKTYERCPKCKKIFLVECTRQTPGFRDSEEMRCPYCDVIVRKSMEWEFLTSKIDVKGEDK